MLGEASLGDALVEAGAGTAPMDMLGALGNLLRHADQAESSRPLLPLCSYKFAPALP